MTDLRERVLNRIQVDLDASWPWRPDANRTKVPNDLVASEAWKTASALRAIIEEHECPTRATMNLAATGDVTFTTTEASHACPIEIAARELGVG